MKDIYLAGKFDLSGRTDVVNVLGMVINIEAEAMLIDE
jgi:hypothetical protein